MRFKAFGIGAAGILAAGTLTVATGAQHVSAASPCQGTVVAVPAASPVGAGSCLEVGTGSGDIYSPVNGAPISAPGVYVIAQGNNNPCLPAPIGCGFNGYIGVSDYETGTAGGTAGPNDPPCDPAGNGQPADSNGGGSVGLDQLTAVGGNPAPGVVAEGCNGQLFVAGVPTVFLVAPVACGNVSGQNFFATSRDGCWEP